MNVKHIHYFLLDIMISSSYSINCRCIWSVMKISTPYLLLYYFVVFIAFANHAAWAYGIGILDALLPRWRHQMETFLAWQALSEGKPPVIGEFSSQRPVTRSFDIFYMCLNTRLSKPSTHRWFELPSRSLQLQCNVVRDFWHGMLGPWCQKDVSGLWPSCYIQQNIVMCNYLVNMNYSVLLPTK